MKEFAEMYVNYIEPGLKVFVMFLLVMAILAFWAKVKEGKVLDLASTIFNGTIDYTYKSFLWIGLSVWLVFRTIGRVFNIIFATVRDFFISRI